MAEMEEECWRELEITPDKTLEKLAEGIVKAFGFDFDHAFGFYSSLDYHYYDAQYKYELFADLGEADEGVMGVQKTKVKDVFPDPCKKMQFVFDYGDNWRFFVAFTGYGEKIPRKRYPCVMEKFGKAPEQYPQWDEEDEDEDVEGLDFLDIEKLIDLSKIDPSIARLLKNKREDSKK